MLRPYSAQFQLHAISEQCEKRFLFLDATHHTVIPSEARNLSFCIRRALFMERGCYRRGPVREMIERFCVRGVEVQRRDRKSVV